MQQDRNRALHGRRACRSAGLEALESRTLFSTLDEVFRYASTDPVRIMTTHDLLRWDTMDAIINRGDADARGLLVKAISEAFPPTSGTDRSVYTSFTNDLATSNGFQFGTRDKLIDLVSTYKMAEYWTEANWRPAVASTVPTLAEMKADIVSAASSYSGYLAANGTTNVGDGRFVGQASAAMALAVAYDWLGSDLSASARSNIAGNLVTYNIAPITSAVARPSGGPFWVTSNLSNWTAICIGSAAMSSLAIRQADYGGNFFALNQSGANVSASLPLHFEDLLAKGLPLLNTVLSSVQIQNGGWDEGPGYQTDMNQFLFGLAVSFDGSLAAGRTLPANVQVFIDNIKTTANKVVYAATHYSKPNGKGDFSWSDGNWSMSGSPINYLIASFASDVWGNNGDWRAAAQQTWNRRSQAGTDIRGGQAVLYRSLFEWTRPYTTGVYAANGKQSMGGYTMAGSGLPTHYFFNNGYFGPTQIKQGSNENVSIWRSGWDDVNGSAVMFKGGDKRADRHDKLDAASFQYDALGASWAVDVGNAAGYPVITLPNGAATRYHTYPQRAVGANTLVINPSTSEYKTDAKFAGTYGALNPDQGVSDGTTWPFAAVNGQSFNEATGIYSANVQLSAAYGRMKLSQNTAAPSTRNYTYSKGSGALTITDTLNFTGVGNEVYWSMHTPAAVTALRSATGQQVALQQIVNGQTTYLEATVVGAPGNPNNYFSYGGLTANLPPDQPAQLWDFSNATQMQNNYRNLSLRLTGIGTSGVLKVVLTPKPEWAGKTSAQVLSLLSGSPQTSAASTQTFAAPVLSASRFASPSAPSITAEMFGKKDRVVRAVLA